MNNAEAVGYKSSSPQKTKINLLSTCLLESLKLIKKRFKLLTKMEATDASGRLSIQVVSLFCYARNHLGSYASKRTHFNDNISP